MRFLIKIAWNFIVSWINKAIFKVKLDSINKEIKQSKKEVENDKKNSDELYDDFITSLDEYRKDRDR